MRAFWKLSLVLGVAALMAGPALAQQGGGGGRRGQGGGFGGGASVARLLANKGVQEELKLSSEQVDKSKAAADKVQEKYKDDLAKIRDLSDNERREKGAEVRKSMAADLNKALAEVLKPEQAKRLHQIELQTRGLAALNDAEVQKTLKVSDEQKGKLKTIEDDSRKEMRDAFQGGGGGGGATDGARAKIAEMRKASMDKAVGVLSDDQKKAWKDMTGAPFEVKFEGGTGGGGRRPRGNNNT